MKVVVGDSVLVWLKKQYAGYTYLYKDTSTTSTFFIKTQVNELVLGNWVRFVHVEDASAHVPDPAPTAK